MIEKLNNLNGVAFRGYSTVSQNFSNPIDNQPREFNSDFYVDKKGAEAIKVRSFVANPLDINKPISMNDYKNQLIKAGLVENKDFDIINDNEDGGGSIFVTKGREEPIKAVHWHNGKGSENYAGYKDCFYPKNQGDLTKFSYYCDENGVVEEIRKRYSNPEAHMDLFPENMTINTTPEEYTKLLEKQGIKYEVDKQNVDGTIYIVISEAAPDGTLSKRTSFLKSNDGSKSIYHSCNPDGKGNLVHGINIYKDGDFYEMTITDYVKDQGIKNSIKY